MRTTWAALAAIVISTGALVVTGPSATAAVSDVPADCGVWTSAYKSDGQRISYGYENKSKKTVQYPGDKLSWIPSALQQVGAAGDIDLFISTELATHPSDGYIYQLDRRGERTNGVWRMTQNKATRITSGFSGTKTLSIGYEHVYRISGTALYRYKLTYSNGLYRLSGRTTVASKNWNTVKTLTFERRTGSGSSAADAFLVTLTNGQLRDYRIPISKPTTYTSKVLKSSGWSGFASLSTGYCSKHPKGRPLLGITSGGSASVYLDANATDGVGTDIKGGSLGSLGWTGKGYSQ